MRVFARGVYHPVAYWAASSLLTSGARVRDGVSRRAKEQRGIDGRRGGHVIRLLASCAHTNAQLEQALLQVPVRHWKYVSHVLSALAP